MIELTFVRHGETDANVAGIWQGQGDSALSVDGRSQARELGGRLRRRSFDLVVSSDLTRTRTTAELAGFDPHPDAVWREVDIGRWEGLTREEVFEGHRAEIEAVGRGEPVKLGGGESWEEFGRRIDTAVESLIDRLSDGARVLIVAHGGVIHSVVAGHLGFRRQRRPWPIEHLRNTSLTVLRIGERGRQLLTYNDAAHLGDVPPSGPGTVVGLIRHGETVANVEGRWAGSTDAPLSDEGRRQAAELPSRYDGARHVYTSPLSRARETAAAFANAHRLAVRVREDLAELHFGTWENLTAAEIMHRYPEEWSTVYERGIDRPRGGVGETAGAAAVRFRGAVEDIAAAHSGERVAVVSHGGVIRAFVGSLVGIDHGRRHLLALPGNTSVSHVRVGDEMVLIDYNLGAV